MRTHRMLIMIVMGLYISMLYGGEGKVKWGYTGKIGPVYWGSLSPEFEMCSKGKNQSPIDLKGFIEADLPELNFEDNGHAIYIENNGHAIKVGVSPGTTVEIDGRKFTLLQFHFHSPSENLIEGRSFPMEAHFVYQDKDGNLAVVALLFEYGEKNPLIEKLWKKMPEKVGKNKITFTCKPHNLLPKNKDYYRFNGSLTTPPCTEGVRWIVLKEYATVSKEQVERFKKVMGMPNNRPVQPVNARVILK